VHFPEVIYGINTMQTIAGLKQMVRDSKAEMENARTSSNTDLDSKIVKKSQEVGPKGPPGVSVSISPISCLLILMMFRGCANL
jgi:hypothetical protein